jgi:hypothetical protein
MTVRDWMPIVGALLIPIVIAVGTWVITLQQGNIEDERKPSESLRSSVRRTMRFKPTSIR